jgi:DNA-binding transcriptional LysR family regulator
MNTLLNLDFLATFVKVAEHKELKKVAEELYKSPSTISTQIKKLEEQTNRALIIRKLNGIELTEEGLIVLNYAKKMIELNNTLFLSLGKQELSGTIHIGIPTDYAEIFAKEYLPCLKSIFPNVDFNILCSRSRTLRKKIKNDQLDIAIVVDEMISNDEDLLWSEKMYWVHGKEFDIGNYDLLPVAIFNDDCIVRDLTIKSLEINKMPYKEVISSSTLGNIVSFVKSNQAVSLITGHYINTDELSILPTSFIPLDITLNINLIFSEQFDKEKKKRIRKIFKSIQIDIEQPKWK